MANTLATTEVLKNASVTNDKLAGSISQDKLAGAIPISKLSATGTASSSTFLRGDGSWQGAGGPGSFNVDYYTSGSGTWTCPQGVTKVLVTVAGGGCGGGNFGQGGHGGIVTGLVSVTPGTSYNYSVGAGTGSSNGAATAGTSSFSSVISANGGGYNGGYGNANYGNATNNTTKWSTTSGTLVSGGISSPNYSSYNPTFDMFRVYAQGNQTRTGSGNTCAIAWTFNGNSRPGAGAANSGVNYYPGPGGVGGAVIIVY